MQAAGCERWEPAESLAVMGLFEVLKDLPRLVRLIGRIRRMFLTARPDVFVGIDAPDTNLRIAPSLRAAGIPTVQYVSPQVWAWRQGRARSIHAAVDLVLCLLPFEKRFYDQHGTPAEFVGHPLADAIPLIVDRAAARATLNLDPQAQIVALLPGSRRGEVRRLSGDFAATARWLAKERPALQFVAPMASAEARAIFSETLAREAPQVEVRLIDGQAQTRAHCGRCGAGGVRHRQPGNRALRPADGGGVPPGRVDRVFAAPPESGESQVFCAAKSACG